MSSIQAHSPISVEVLVQNLQNICALKKGSKLISHESTGEISFENRIFLVSWRRSYSKAFDPESLRWTFEEAIRQIQVEKEDTSLQEKLLSLIPESNLTELFKNAVQSTETLEETYKAEKKQDTAERIQSVRAEFIERIEEMGKKKLLPYHPFCAGLPPWMINAITVHKKE